MIDPTDVTSTRYRIGAVAKLTGIAPDTLRIWERRYAAVTPQRSPRGGRLYSAGDLGRLRMMKLLVDAGDAIGEIAGLDTETLRDRLAQTRHASPDTGPTPLSSCRLTLVGESLASILEVPGGTLTGITLVTAYRDTAAGDAARGQRCTSGRLACPCESDACGGGLPLCLTGGACSAAGLTMFGPECPRGSAHLAGALPGDVAHRPAGFHAGSGRKCRVHPGRPAAAL
jgi:DNA-binding transcriptional MerR regulator